MLDLFLLILLIGSKFVFSTRCETKRYNKEDKDKLDIAACHLIQRNLHGWPVRRKGVMSVLVCCCVFA